MTGYIAIQADRVSKEYRLGGQSNQAMGQDLVHLWRTWRAKRRAMSHGQEAVAEALAAIEGDQPKSQDKHFLALDQITFAVNAGDALGIIGANGSGKSTLLKIIARVTRPTSGEVIVRGRLLSMLEVGTGFHPELSGRDNVFLNGMLLGMTKAEVQRKFDEILAFAEVERFIDTPVKRYSSGMQVRLAFSVAAHFDPEIMLIDEVLAVGDAKFQKKCQERMHQILQSGHTILFVSHNISTVSALCNKGMLLDHGRSICFGPMAEAAMVYDKANNAGQYVPTATYSSSATSTKKVGDGRAELIEAGIYNDNGAAADELPIDQGATVRMSFRLDASPGATTAPAIKFLRMDGATVFMAAPPGLPCQSSGCYTAVCQIPANFLNDGIYYVGVQLVSHLGSMAHTHFSEDRLLTFRVTEDETTLDADRFRYGSSSVIPGGVRPTDLLKWSVERTDG